jgi:hypothetical protein
VFAQKPEVAGARHRGAGRFRCRIGGIVSFCLLPGLGLLALAIGIDVFLLVPRIAIGNGLVRGGQNRANLVLREADG